MGRRGGYLDGRWKNGGVLMDGGKLLDDLLSSSRTRACSNAFSFYEASKLACKEAIRE